MLSSSALVSVRCDLCGADRGVEVMRKRGDLYDHEFSIVRCRNCSLVYVNPRLDDETIAGLYDEAYYQGLGFDKTVCYERDSLMDIDQIRSHNADFVATIGEALGGLERRSIVDVGCGMGGLVRSLRAAGADAIGMDSSRSATAACSENGTPLADGDVDELASRGVTFDALVSTEVIEHTLSPKAFLSSVMRLIKPGGILYVTTGNWNLVRLVPGTPYVMPEGHIYYFTPVTMRRYFDLVGLGTTDVLNRSWSGWRAFRGRLNPAIGRSLAGAFAGIAPGYGPFPVGVRK